MSTHSFLPTPFRMPCCASFSPPLLRPSFLLVSLLSFLPSFFLSFFSFSTFNPPVVFSLPPLLHPFFLLFFSPAHSFDHFGFKTHFLSFFKIIYIFSFISYILFDHFPFLLTFLLLYFFILHVNISFLLPHFPPSSFSFLSLGFFCCSSLFLQYFSIFSLRSFLSVFSAFYVLHFSFPDFYLLSFFIPIPLPLFLFFLPFFSSSWFFLSSFWLDIFKNQLRNRLLLPPENASALVSVSMSSNLQDIYFVCHHICFKVKHYSDSLCFCSTCRIIQCSQHYLRTQREHSWLCVKSPMPAHVPLWWGFSLLISVSVLYSNYVSRAGECSMA